MYDRIYAPHKLLACLGEFDLLPLRAYHAFNPNNDTVPYIGVAEWLQDHGYGVPVPHNPQQPIQCLVHDLSAAIDRRDGAPEDDTLLMLQNRWLS